MITSRILRHFSNRFNPVYIGDVTMRDGLQSVKKIIDTKHKINVINTLSKCGYDYIEVGSIVSSKFVPQMANSAEVFTTIEKNNNIQYGLLTIGKQNIFTAVDLKPDILALVTSMSPDFCKKNMNTTVIDSIGDTIRGVMYAKSKNISTRVYISCCSTCPITDNSMYTNVVGFIKELPFHYINQIMISDTTGMMNLHMFDYILSELTKYNIPTKILGLHLHENKHSIDIIKKANDYGITIYDTTFSDLGGCIVIKNPHNNLSIGSLTMTLPNNRINKDKLNVARELINNPVN